MSNWARSRLRRWVSVCRRNLRQCHAADSPARMEAISSTHHQRDLSLRRSQIVRQLATQQRMIEIPISFSMRERRIINSLSARARVAATASGVIKAAGVKFMPAMEMWRSTGGGGSIAGHKCHAPAPRESKSGRRDRRHALSGCPASLVASAAKRTILRILSRRAAGVRAAAGDRPVLASRAIQ